MGRMVVSGRIFFAWILAWLTVATEAAQPLPPARNLAEDAGTMRTNALPMMILFSRDHCRWCEKARRENLRPIAAENPVRTLLREVNIDSDEPLIDFAGHPTSHRAFAAAHGARLAPTLMVFTADGVLATEPLVGYPTADYYSLLIDQKIENGRQRMQGRTP